MPPPTLSEQIYTYANSRVGQQVGTGECFDLADLALRAVGARTAEDYGRVTRNANYRWGRTINRQLATVGDVIQFQNYQMTITTVTKVTQRNGSWTENTNTQTQSRPHHTATIARVGQNGGIEVLEQNVGSGTNQRRVQRNSLYFGSPASTTTTATKDGVTTTVRTTVQVAGTAQFYRAEARQ